MEVKRADVMYEESNQIYIAKGIKKNSKIRAMYFEIPI